MTSPHFSPAPQRVKTPRGPVIAAISDGAGLLGATLVLFGLCGAIWGLFIPRTKGALADDGTLALDPTQWDFFSSFLQFIASTALLGVAVALVYFVHTKATRGVLMLLWLIVVMGLASVVFHDAGLLAGQAAGSLSTEEGEVSFLLGTNVGVVGYLVAPFSAALSYWLAFTLAGEQALDEGHRG